MLAHTREGFADLRVVDAGGAQVPWRRVPEERVVVGHEAAVLNSGRRGDAAVALVDVGGARRVYERVELGIDGGNFVGRVTALGADRRDGPFTRLSTTTVYDVRGASGRAARRSCCRRRTTGSSSCARAASGGSPARRCSGAFERPDLVRRRHAVLRRAATTARTTITTLDFGVAGVPVTRLELRAPRPRATTGP